MKGQYPAETAGRADVSFVEEMVPKKIRVRKPKAVLWSQCCEESDCE